MPFLNSPCHVLPETHAGKDIVATEEDVVEKRAEDASTPSRPETRRFLRGERA